MTGFASQGRCVIIELVADEAEAREVMLEMIQGIQGRGEISALVVAMAGIAPVYGYAGTLDADHPVQVLPRADLIPNRNVTVQA